MKKRKESDLKRINSFEKAGETNIITWFKKEGENS